MNVEFVAAYADLIELIEGKLDQFIRFWTQEVGVDEVITRKFLSWDDNTTIQLGHALDPHLYKAMPPEKKESGGRT